MKLKRSFRSGMSWEENLQQGGVRRGRSEEGEEKEKRDTKQGKRNNENSRKRGENKCR